MIHPEQSIFQKFPSPRSFYLFSSSQTISTDEPDDLRSVVDDRPPQVHTLNQRSQTLRRHPHPKVTPTQTHSDDRKCD